MQNVKTAAELAADLDNMKAERDSLQQQLAIIEESLKKDWRDKNLQAQRSELSGSLGAVDLALNHLQAAYSTLLAEERLAEFTAFYDKTDEALSVWLEIFTKAQPALDKLQQCTAKLQEAQSAWLYTLADIRHLDETTHPGTTFEQAIRGIASSLSAPVGPHDKLLQHEDDLAAAQKEWRALRTKLMKSLADFNACASDLAALGSKLRDIGLAHNAAQISTAHKWRPAYLNGRI